MPGSTDALKPVLTSQGWEMLNSLPEYDDATSAQLNKQLRHQGWKPDVVAAALTQSRLRRDAHPKFGEFASRMLFTEAGLQQSTRLPVAARHAARFRDAGLSHVADLGCGLGGDAMAMASAGLAVTAVEADEPTAAAALMNLKPFPEADIVHDSAESWVAENITGTPHDAEPGTEEPLHSGMPGLWLDPARRNERSRLWDPEEFSPPLSFVMELAATGAPLGVKLGPGIPHALIPENCEAEWVSIDGELVEVVLWFNALARPSIRRAATALTTMHAHQEPNHHRDAHATLAAEPINAQTQVRLAGEITSSAEFGAGLEVQATGREALQGTVWEPDPGVIRAGLVAELCAQMNGQMLDEHIAYFSIPDAEFEDTDTPAATAGYAPSLARGYRVLEVMDFQVKALKRWAQHHELTSVEIKKRGVDVTPETLRRQILPKKPTGPKKHALLLVTRLAEDRVVAVIEPLPATTHN